MTLLSIDNMNLWGKAIENTKMSHKILRVRISSKYVFNDYDSFLNDVVYFDLNQLKQNTNASLCRSL